MSGFRRVLVLGAGAWGTALAMSALRAGCEVTLWARDATTLRDIELYGENRKRLPGIPLGPGLALTPDLAQVRTADLVILAVPAQTVRQVSGELCPHLVADTPVVVAAKGFERDSGALMSAVLAEALPAATPAVLSGPSFAADVAAGLPTAVTLAAADAGLAKALVASLGHQAFRPYSSTDLVGVQAGGAVKNVLAIACGAAKGRGLGASASAALISRSLAELRRLGQAMGGRPETMMGLSGLGDLVLTATSEQSRNMSFGLALGRGGTLDAALAGQTAVTEGVFTAPAVVGLARRLNVEMPVCDAVARVLAGELDVARAVEALLARPFRDEE
ncbi:NAD(P)H-dependent glycerol-3-phosphate dehydrogenase [Lutibaculum baratangense]|uniref:Glycerol-3-phosphate dehydrogenase [NAD(P)+] n=1 Tax=Lutibaculum baratangense AMV1 TaxID=631454 RepID=V4T7H5_9HYPH|nr:NAD(P)H-dependent glycerol-3-phosphate dehydrogenase [Lutibaculum baratangense]ESR22573.1 Glycerol-3-phosphate dehydrogenase [NAD(P)+] [Lutibaculum baratangense AMV1]